MIKIHPYLMVKNGKESIELYKELFGAKVKVHMPFEKEAGASMGFPDDFNYENSTMHSELDIGGGIIMLSDSPMFKVGPGSVMVYINFDSKEIVDKINEKVQEKKYKIIMPYKETPFGTWFLMFEDSNGIGWQCEFGEAKIP